MGLARSRDGETGWRFWGTVLPLCRYGFWAAALHSLPWSLQPLRYYCKTASIPVPEECVPMHAGALQ